ncbi:hypothetical protein A3C23_04830 [Candidatus Roizmanbacteria bacterium RIFCSPHIGHO2_02_FULL_37_13b]|uniref:Dockerin domain-containing protein n=1 Tax=Candidatus Roizmanbacteria bacterium RIFCSPLOWO2_02_FULL_36_11 TaxID=1802071 RepID=A0A1F7JIE2_9BACT|nr:MAG: hypothetical protein A3C23_04830 [Candidatus Roizmanbacteria bacterium RIFCSPHIGHO2_02_FULL_37_13b]OGK55368.1 MAG: hypothetical protein A3H78_03635 [Candidatus Roizmanbacteria bacterium RIFCSPLOWO2_02_FULL_36_11]
MNDVSKKKVVLLLAVGVLAAALFGYFLSVYVFRTRAVTEQINVTFSPASLSSGLNVEKQIDIVLAAPQAKGISGVDLTLNAQNAKIFDLSNVSPLGSDNKSVFTEVKKTTTTDGSSSTKASVTISGDTDLPQIVRMKVSFKCLTAGTAKLSIDKSKLEVVGNITNNTYDVGSVEEATITCTTDVSVTPGIQPTAYTGILPTSSNFAPGVKAPYYMFFAIDKSTTTSSSAISAVDVNLTFDPKIVEISEIGDLKDFGTLMPNLPASLLPLENIVATATPDISTLPALPCTKIDRAWDNSTGQIHISYVCVMSADKLPQYPVISLTLLGKAQGQGELAYQNAKITGNIPQDAYVVKTSNAKYYVGDQTQGNVKLNLKLKFQGIENKQPAENLRSMVVKCSLSDGGLSSIQSQSATFTSDANGIWSGSLSYGVPAGSGYKVLCKGPKHLQKKICDAKPIETYPGTYSCDHGQITLKSGENNFDFSGIYMLVGDLPPQNGLVNAYDLSLIINLLDRSDAESVRVADLNLDNNVGAMDQSLVISALSHKLDEQ